jgi:hypothetical protein
VEARGKSVIKKCALAGLLIPVGLMVGKFVELGIDKSAVPYSSLYGVYLWPTSIFLIGSEPGIGPKPLIWLALSILLNAVLYAMIGAVVVKVRKNFGRSTSGTRF